MLTPRWLTTWHLWAVCASTSIQGTSGEGQQPICLARNWREIEAAFLEWPTCFETRWDTNPNNDQTSASQDAKSVTGEPSLSVSVTVEGASASPPPSQEADHELDTDSPLDNANFLSFEDWKKQNLAKAGQSAENLGGNRRGGTAEKDRRRPTGINNALDALGDDGEIELDFGGFGADASEAAKTAASWGTQQAPGGGEGEQAPLDKGSDEATDTFGQGVPQAGGPRSKDAGTTCKERFNYASFDCAATVLKTNPQAKGSSAVLIENRDSYMLNECQAQNKFLILELCDDILVDTVVLGNYEFFSSIFHTFRVSVTDRYPAKPDQWKGLGIYEARNTREIQAFPVENPLIWARYLRIEFLTHYGNEFFCPLSLIRVHGTTMLEEYKHDGDVSRTEEEEVVEEVSEPPEAESATKTVTETNDLPSANSPDTHILNVGKASLIPETSPNIGTSIEWVLLGLGDSHMCRVQDAPVEPPSDEEVSPGPGQASPSAATLSTGETGISREGTPPSPEAGGHKASAPVGTNTHPPGDSAPVVSDTNPENATAELDTRSSNIPKDEQSAESIRATTTQPPSANPTTQESFFKSVNKRLQMLESNSSLSLQYIEEQSRILRDAFSKVEKRQLSKTSTFLDNLNVTVVNELKQSRDQYDQVWRSVAMEFEHQRIQYHQELHSLSTQLGVLADEIVFQKRIAVIQSIVVLFCFGLVLFTRGSASNYVDLPSVQNMVSGSYSLRSSSPIFGSPPGSPGSPESTRPVSSYRSPDVHRRQISDDSQGGSLSPAAAYAPPTPTSDDSGLGRDMRGATPSASGDSRSAPGLAPPLLRSNSSPADLKGENEGGLDDLGSESECSDSDE